MKKLFAILCLLAAVGAAQAIDYGTPYAGSTPQIYTQPVQTSMTIGGYSTVATGGMTTTGEGGVISGAMRAPAGGGSYVGEVRYDGGKPFIWNGSTWVADDDDEETSRPELDIVPVGDTIWPLMLMAVLMAGVIYMRRRKQQEA